MRGRLRLTPTPDWTVDLNVYRSRAVDRTGYIYAPVDRFCHSIFVVQSIRESARSRVASDEPTQHRSVSPHSARI